jgi:hypothetical protein
MPCFTISTVTIELKATNKEWIMEVLESMGYKPREAGKDIIISNLGEFNIDSGRADVPSYKKNEFRKFQQNYSKHILKVASKKYKFITKQDTKNPNHFVVARW